MRMAWAGAGLLAWMLLYARAEEPRSFGAAVGDYVERHCADCHSGDNPKGDLDLARFSTADMVRQEPGIWRRVRHALRTGAMPPAKRERPDKRETDAVIEWLGTLLPEQPGRVRWRRLPRSAVARPAP
jgi:mono/diheme cytochrome c family protein